ncbi:MAG: response regulator, partial [Candidatus Rokuibacteriota bacterium]
AELQVAEEAAWRAAEAVRGFLGYAPGHRAAPLVPLDLGAVIRDAVDAARRRWVTREDSPPAVTLDLAAMPPIRGRADDLREALDQILENAGEAVPASGAITVRARWDGNRRVEVLVEDAGTGMAEVVRARALEPFFSTKGPGRLGLGLPVAQAIVTHHGGTLDLVSVPEAGTTVRLTVPTAAAGSRVSLTADPGIARVLVVEGETTVRETLVALLEREGHIVLSASGGSEGLAIVQQEAVDVVFTSLVVPGTTGLEMARDLRRLRPGTPVILLTAWPGRLDDEVIRECGIHHVIEKPVGVREVLAALDTALAMRRTIRP